MKWKVGHFIFIRLLVFLGWARFEFRPYHFFPLLGAHVNDLRAPVKRLEITDPLTKMLVLSDF